MTVGGVWAMFLYHGTNLSNAEKICNDRKQTITDYGVLMIYNSHCHMENV